MTGNRDEKGPDYRFFIDKEGDWYQDGIKVRHRLTYLYNNKLLDRDPEGRYFVDEGSGRLYVRVEDTPFVVKMVYKRGDEFYIRLNDETEERLDPGSLRIDGGNVPYTKVKDKKYDARFSRPAYYELMKYVQKEEKGYVIETGGTKHLIRKE